MAALSSWPTGWLETAVIAVFARTSTVVPPPLTIVEERGAFPGPPPFMMTPWPFWKSIGVASVRIAEPALMLPVVCCRLPLAP